MHMLGKIDGLKKLSFNDAMAKINEIEKKLDSKDCQLEEMMDLYEEGTMLIHACEEKLAKAKMRMEYLRSEKYQEEIKNAFAEEGYDDIQHNVATEQK